MTTNEQTPEQMWTVKQCAAFLNVTTWFVYKHAERGTLPALHFGRALRFDPAAVKAWAASSTGAK
ncbi:MAG: helix-turn-helix domain-containing protein [Deltaproteobacteria bacterium]|nr:helix-turn-helix domain-containing protein [Deltaproteobacteria bacterium]